jgi:hypothetical protein
MPRHRDKGLKILYTYLIFLKLQEKHYFSKLNL